MADLQLADEDRAAIKAVLIAERDRGVAVPLLPADVDVDGDGIVDSFGLDENGEVIIVSGVHLEHTVYLSEGDDVLGHLPEEA